MTNVAPSIERLAVRTPTLPPATHTNAYVVGTREAVLIEPASPYEDEIERLLAWAASLGLAFRAVLLTHHHPDHVGGAARARAALGVPLWAHELTAARLRERATGVVVDRVLDEGDEISLDGPIQTTLRAVHTPGHAPGHLCFVDSASGMVIAGDMVASVGTILVEPVDGDMQLYLASLARMRTLDAKALLPAHGEPIADADAKLAQYIAHRGMREGKVVDALARRGDAVPLEVLVQAAYDDAPSALWPIAQMSLEAHLIKLEREGRAARTRDGRWKAERT